jgi:hypothetical protein
MEKLGPIPEITAIDSSDEVSLGNIGVRESGVPVFEDIIGPAHSSHPKHSELYDKSGNLREQSINGGEK